MTISYIIYLHERNEKYDVFPTKIMPFSFKFLYECSMEFHIKIMHFNHGIIARKCA